jgi:hypothetical protein
MSPLPGFAHPGPGFDASPSSFVCHQHMSFERRERRSASIDRASRLCTPRQMSPATQAAAASNLCTPQPSRVELDMKAVVDAELDCVNDAERQRGVFGFAPLTQLLPNLLIGCFPSGETLAQLHALGVTHIVNCCALERRLPAALPFVVCPISAHDSPDYYIILHDYDAFATAVDDALRGGGKVFVHCVAGINRSVTLCVAYLMHRQYYSLLDAVRLFRAQGRPRILENHAFRKQLVDFYLTLKHSQQQVARTL